MLKFRMSEEQYEREWRRLMNEKYSIKHADVKTKEMIERLDEINEEVRMLREDYTN